MREVVDRVRPLLRPFRDERGRELLDLPDAPRPPEDTPAPVRFLPEYDNVLLSHADRSRFQAAGDLGGAVGPARGTALVDGVVQAVWHSELDRKAGRAAVVVEHLALPQRSRRQLEAEAERMAAFWHEGLETTVTVRPV
jgi:hypothetical protein